MQEEKEKNLVSNNEKATSIEPYAINIKNESVTLAANQHLEYYFDNKGTIGTHSKCTVNISRNAGLLLVVTLINRDTGGTLDSVRFPQTTGEHVFRLDSGVNNYKIYIGNKSNKSGQITFSIKTS